eukprot:5885995-Pyramimonas_sp.AAC.1
MYPEGGPIAGVEGVVLAEERGYQPAHRVPDAHDERGYRGESLLQDPLLQPQEALRRGSQRRWRLFRYSDAQGERAVETLVWMLGTIVWMLGTIVWMLGTIVWMSRRTNQTQDVRVYSHDGPIIGAGGSRRSTRRRCGSNASTRACAARTLYRTSSATSCAQ